MITNQVFVKNEPNRELSMKLFGLIAPFGVNTTIKMKKESTTMQDHVTYKTENKIKKESISSDLFYTSDFSNEHVIKEQPCKQPQKCNECEFECSSDIALLGHEQTHNDNKPGMCEEYDCSAKGTDEHVAYNKNDDGKNNYKCNACDYTRVEPRIPTLQTSPPGLWVSARSHLSSLR